MTLKIAQPGELCAMKQSPSMKIRELMLWNTKEQSGRGFNLAATSALGPVTVALASAAPELDSTLINKLTDDRRSVVFDGAVRSVPVEPSLVNYLRVKIPFPPTLVLGEFSNRLKFTGVEYPQ